MKCPKCQSTKLVTGNAGLMSLIPFLYCPVCKVEAVEDAPAPPAVPDLPPTLPFDWYMGVVVDLDMTFPTPTYQVQLSDGNIVTGYVLQIPMGLPIFRVGDLVEIQRQWDPVITAIRPRFGKTPSKSLGVLNPP